MPSDHLACNLDVWNDLTEQQRRIIDTAWMKVGDIATLSLILLLGMFALLAIGMPLGFASAEKWFCSAIPH